MLSLIYGQGDIDLWPSSNGFFTQDGQFYFMIHRQGYLDNDDLCLESRNSLALISYGGQQSSEELCPSLNWYCILYRD